jgi:hypothetical protein
MKPFAKRSLSVLAVTMVTGLAVFAVVSLAGKLEPSTAVASTLICPRTGCTASTCHATQGGSSFHRRYGYGDAQQGWSAPRGESSGQAQRLTYY